ncbi:MmcQ/YjbR family DNA-binding protein [Agrobacterium tumefaciens]|uniref:MmcQ/YjbR family DNA-binding protein n=1 Tax=Agrobacterium tumefaciens TaxID=358 RepID=UPI0015739AA2|nr:MmcQ/YjbR family DNA-binding protein [Agrobacterium tumefaciens]NTA19011.1 MmcQ/YjbR family DNA-binding protein [Agrobacterium tumefaciens]WCK74427.1 MmcQ/YjbR family DNA-binding protein [Agrobacterium tumefaciens]
MITRSEIFDYAEKTFGTKPDYPFKKYPHYAVLRHSDDQKWFGLIMNLPRDKLGLEGEGEVDVIDIRCHPAKVDDLKRTSGFRPAYHMNKQHWLTVVLDGSVSWEDVFALLEDSYERTK